MRNSQLPGAQLSIAEHRRCRLGQLYRNADCPNGVPQYPLHTRKRGNSATIVIVAILVAILLGFGAWKLLRGVNHPAPRNPDSSHSELILPAMNDLS